MESNYNINADGQTAADIGNVDVEVPLDDVSHDNLNGVQPQVIASSDAQPQLNPYSNLEPLKTSQFDQPAELTEFFIKLLDSDPYNKYCFDCHKNQCTHAVLTYGVLVCSDCARGHFNIFGGRTRSQIKDLFHEMWDDHQIEAISPGLGGNLLCYSFLYEYKLNNLGIYEKYSSNVMKYYVRMFQARLDRRPFFEQAPSRDWNDTFGRTQNKLQAIADKYEAKLINFGKKIDKKIEQKGWKDKFKGLIGGKKNQDFGEEGFDQENEGIEAKSGNRFSNIFKKAQPAEGQYSKAHNTTDANLTVMDQKHNLDDVTNLYDDSGAHMPSEPQNNGQILSQRRI